ncbi:MAG TPA: DUF45 domain-containing protein [bacterium]|nr:DUF45 domain-containing protein [bacterium]
MEKVIKIFDQEIKYQLKSSYRAKNMRLSIYGDGRFIATKPRIVSEKTIEKFIITKAHWIIERLKKSNNGLLFSKEEDRKIYQKYRESARRLVNKKIDYFNQFYNFKYGRISIRNQKTRWGSCSRQGNLNFSYRIFFLPENLINYIIVHEICHLGEFNHSKNFWLLVKKTIPNYLTIRSQLKNNKL